MIGFMVWRTGSASHPVAFVYATDREECKRVLRQYLLQGGIINFFNPDNWVVEPVTNKQEHVSQVVVICPDISKVATF